MVCADSLRHFSLFKNIVYHMVSRFIPGSLFHERNIYGRNHLDSVGRTGPKAGIHR